MRALAVVLALASLVRGDEPAALEATPHAVEVFVEGLKNPWALDFAPDGRLFITEAGGRLRVVTDGVLDPRPERVLGVAQQGQGGLLDLAFHPDFARNRLLYLAFTAGTGSRLMTRVARYRAEGGSLGPQEIVFEGAPGGGDARHFGCRLAFGADGKLYLTLGERHDGKRAQDLMDLNGKTLRLNDDGTVPADNPFAGREGARPEIFSYGHRNSQGMAVQPSTGLIFQTEHGPTGDDAPGGGDEVNIVEAGRNYGWPLVHHRDTREGTVPPLLEYTPAIAPAGAIFYTGDAFKEWKGDFLFANLVGKRLVRVKLDGRKVVEQEVLLKGTHGRLRDAAQGPDGCVYVITSNTDAMGGERGKKDRVLKLRPSSDGSR
jgi:glucose/arabinose dehydrogenase